MFKGHFGSISGQQLLIHHFAESGAVATLQIFIDHHADSGLGVTFDEAPGAEDGGGGGHGKQDSLHHFSA